MFFLLCLSFVVGPLALAQTTLLAQTNESVEERRARLQAELEAEEREIARQTELLRAKQKDTATVQGEVNLLQNQIKQAETRIKAKRVEISRLEDDILGRQNKISQLQSKIKQEQTSLAEMLRKTREVDESTLVEIMLDNVKLSEFFNDVDDFSSVEQSLHLAFAEMRGAQIQAAKEKESLEDRRVRELDAKAAIEADKQLVAKQEAEKKVLLDLHKTQEKTYEQILAERRRRASQIRAALFALRDSAAIPFGKALEYATFASQKTGVRPAFLLAILKQESNLGENVGTCNRPTDPASKHWQAIMPGASDIAAGLSKRNDEAAFIRITSELGLDPDSLPLSCPWGNGWGGAMGPAQFIPTTWELYKSKIAAALGKPVPNPWEPQDAFMASAIYLAELGANQGGANERIAALKYYAGGNWSNPKNAFYGNQVVAHAVDIQLNMINPLQDV